ncbi:MAG: hypothetical protein KIH64_011465 [Mycobacterium sp.]|nr:hypothetical protein [Mycobacterium sp.]
MAAGIAAVVTGCGSHAPQSPGSTTAVSVPASGEMAHLAAVRLAAENGHDRLEFEFTDRVPGYIVGYETLPAHADASGAEIPLPGAASLVQISFNPATGQGWGGGPRTYLGPASVTAATRSVTEVTSAGDFEAVLTWVVGLRSTVPFRVDALDGPPRLVITFQH